MKFFIFVLLFILSPMGMAQDAAFIYDDHGKRDPFIPLVSASGMVMTYDEDLAVGDLVLEGIATDAQGGNIAIVNGRVVQVGTRIGVYVVEGITPDHVEFLKGTQKIAVGIKKVKP